jgi:hypothetical protein
VTCASCACLTTLAHGFGIGLTPDRRRNFDCGGATSAPPPLRMTNNSCEWSPAEVIQRQRAIVLRLSSDGAIPWSLTKETKENRMISKKLFAFVLPSEQLCSD